MAEESRPGQGSGFVTAANAFTASRLIILPFMIAGIRQGIGLMVVIGMALVIITDLIDGRLARRQKQASPAGATLDSTVDFVVIYGLFIAFFAAKQIEWYQFAFIYAAMLSLLLLQIVSMATGQANAVVKTVLGKPMGMTQYIYLLLLVARVQWDSAVPLLKSADQVLFIVLAVLIVASSAEFLAKLRKVV